MVSNGQKTNEKSERNTESRWRNTIFRRQVTQSSLLPIFPPISPTLFTLVCHLRQHINHLTHAGTPTMSPSLPCQRRQHVNHVTQVSAPPTLARYPRKHVTDATHASTTARHFSNSIIIQFLHKTSCNFILHDKGTRNLST